MATIGELVRSGYLVKMGGNLRPREQPLRRIYAKPTAIDWMKANLNSLASDGFVRQARTPMQQAVEITHAFIVGDDLHGELEPHIMKPESEGVWTIRTPDLRLYGWFAQRCIFVLTSIDTKANLVGNRRIYDQHVQGCCTFRAKLDLDEPKTIHGDLTYVTRV